MEFIEVTVFTTSEGIDIVSGALSLGDAAINDFIIADSRDFSDFLQTNTPRWDYIDDSLMSLKDAESNVKFFVPDNTQGRSKLDAAMRALDALKSRDTHGSFGRLAVETRTVRESDWENNWKAYFKPFPVGDRFFIKPSWETLLDDCGRIVLEIDPGSSFGTGTHATTQLCIAELETVIQPGAAVADIGCGSGILSLAAILLGATRVTAVDVDENAARIAGENIRKSAPLANVQLEVGDITNDAALRARVGSGYDVVVANIVADVIIGMKSIFGGLLAPDGVLIVSGIIGGRTDEVLGALTSAGFSLVSSRDQNDWYCFRFI